MRVSQGSLMSLTRSAVVELRFVRRRDKPGWSPYRRGLVTNNSQLLNSAPGQMTLHFKPPTYPPPYNWFDKNLVCTWDIFWQDWRMVPAESTDVVTVFPVQTEEDINKWWAYFSMYIHTMSQSDKIAFMNR